MTTHVTSLHALPKQLWDYNHHFLSPTPHPRLLWELQKTPTHTSHRENMQTIKKRRLKKKETGASLVLPVFEPVGVTHHGCSHTTEKVLRVEAWQLSRNTYMYINFCSPPNQPGRYGQRGAEKQREGNKCSEKCSGMPKTLALDKVSDITKSSQRTWYF